MEKNNNYQPAYKHSQIVSVDDIAYVLDKFIKVDGNGMEGWTTEPDGEDIWINPDFAKDFTEYFSGG